MHALTTSCSRPKAYTCLELFSGIGGFAVIARHRGWRVLRAIDIDENAARVYRRNFDHEHQIRTIESIPVDELASINAEIWWLSPPCQPFTRRGAGRDLFDTRCEALRYVIKAIAAVRPPIVALENVPEFASSVAARFLRDTLCAHHYQFAEQQVCPTQVGVPNRRRRYYLIATQSTLPQTVGQRRPRRPLGEYLDDAQTELLVPDSELARFESAIDCVAASDPSAITSCFTSAYGKSPVHSGSYLKVGERMRRFSPHEILRLFGFPEEFQLCPDLSRRQQWKLVGNSLSVIAVEYFLSHHGIA